MPPNNRETPLDVQEEALANGMRPGAPDWGREPAEHWGRVASDDGEATVETEAGAYEEFYGELAEALRNGGRPPVDPLESVDVLRIIETAFDSARTGSVVPFGP